MLYRITTFAPLTVMSALKQRFRRLAGVVLYLVKVEILVDLFRLAVQILGILHALCGRGELAQDLTNRGAR
jgi:hypothetical protein